MKNLLLLLVIEDLHRNRLPDDRDVLNYALAHPRDANFQQADDTIGRAEYGDLELQRAEAFLSPRYSRPWTVPKLIGWYRMKDKLSIGPLTTPSRYQSGSRARARCGRA